MKGRADRTTRRQILKSTVAAAVAPYVITSPALGGAGRPPASDRITTALIGAGGRGRQIVAGGGQVLAVCDVDARHRRAAKAKVDALQASRDCATYGDFRQVLARDDLDAVIIATPDHWHAPIAIAAMKAAKAVYVEKPMTLTIGQGRRMAQVASRYGAILQVGSQQRSDQKFIRACELVRNGYIGQLGKVLVQIPTRPGSAEPWSPQPVPPQLDYDMWLGPAPWAPYHPDRCHYKFRFVSDYSGGDITNWGAHQLDIAQWGIGADGSGPVRVAGRGKRNATGLHDVFYDVHVDYEYRGGVTVQLRSGGNGVRFEGTEGWIYVSRSKLEAEPASLLTASLGPNDKRLGPALPGLTHMGLWLEAIRGQNRNLLNAPVEVGHRSATVCHLANIAMLLERELRWDPERERFVGDPEAHRLLWRAMREPWRI